MSGLKKTSNSPKSSTSKQGADRAAYTSHAPIAPAPQPVAGMALQRSLQDPSLLSAGGVLQLQRTAGNRAVNQLLAWRVAQAKLTVGAADDPYEREADRVATQVMSASTMSVVSRQEDDDGTAQRMPATSSITPLAQRVTQSHQPADMSGSFDAGADVERQLSSGSGGAPLTLKLRAELEPMFGADFSSVRVHHGDAQSDQLNRKLGAQAFTHGADIYMGAGKYNPGTGTGKHLLAHELTHVVQQGAAGNITQRKTARLPEAARVQRWFGKSGKADDEEDGGGKGVKGVKAKGTGTLIREAKTAFDAAKPYDTEGEYKTAEDVAIAYVTQSQQKQLTNIAGWTERSKGNKQKRSLKDLLRAFLLKEFAYRFWAGAEGLNQSDDLTVALTPAQEKARDKKYFPRALFSRDQYKPLISKGPAAPETQAWLKASGFDKAIDVDAADTKKAAGGPKIDVRSTFIGFKPLGFSSPRMHLFIVYTSSEGQQYYFRGGPNDDNPPMTVADFGDYMPGTVDWDPSAPSKTVLQGEAAADKFDALIEAAYAINPMEVPYVGYKRDGASLNGENCNATAYTILERAGIPRGKPFGMHPGWGHTLGEFLKQGKNKLPAKEDNSKTEKKLILPGKPEETYQVYKDRGLIEKQGTVNGGSAVDVIETFGDAKTGIMKIRYGEPNVIGYLHNADLPRVGLPFKLKGKPGSLVTLFSSDHTISPDILDAGQTVEVYQDGFAVGAFDDQLVEVGYTLFGTKGEGYVRGRDIVGLDYVEPPSAKDKYKHIKDGVFPVTFTSGKKLVYFTSEVSKEPQDLTLDENLSGRLKVYGALTEHGRCRFEGNGKVYYFNLDDVFDKSGKPDPNITAVSTPMLPLKVEASVDKGPKVVEGIGKEAKLAAFKKVAKGFDDMNGFMFSIDDLVNGAQVTKHDVWLALQAKDDAAEILAAIQGEITAEDLRDYVR